MAAMRKVDILQELNEARTDLLDAIAGLTHDQMMRPGVVGMWSVKDLLSHLVAWESELVTSLNQVQNGRMPSILRIDDIDGWNEEQYHAGARRLLEAVRADFDGVHHMLLQIVNDFDEQSLVNNRRYRWMEGEPLAYLIEENATLHERDHAADIRAWREREGL